MTRRNRISAIVLLWLSAAATLITLARIATISAAERNELRGKPPRQLPATTASGDSHSAALDGNRLREGTRIEDMLGKFEMTGDRITFYPSEGMEPMRVLENLALERISRELSGIARHREWRVTGEITEYHGGNYLLVQRSILKTRSTN